jgi:hypothetical protein
MSIGDTGDTRVLLVDSAAGIYVPQSFAESHQMNEWGVSEEDESILMAGPEEEDYWDVWEEIVSAAIYEDSDGMKWTLHQDGDLWAIREDHEWEED